METCTHWFTGTPDPSISVFKPFKFGQDDDFSLTTSPPQKAKVMYVVSRVYVCTLYSTVQSPDERMHPLWKLHREVNLLDDDAAEHLKVSRASFEEDQEAASINFGQTTAKEMALYRKFLQR